jgi:hypothetical protein
MIVPPALPDDSRLEMIDQSPETSTQLAPRLVLSARLKSSVMVAMTPPDQAVMQPAE